MTLTHRTIAVIPVNGRLPLLRHTIERLIKRNGCYAVVCVGNGEEERRMCFELGAEWVDHANTPLGAKWNAGFQKAAQLQPDSVLFVGSSDWLSDNWLPLMQKELVNKSLVGKLDTYFIDWSLRHGFNAIWWPGYPKDNKRHGEPIGIGRLIHARLLDKMYWTPMDPFLNNSMDYSMIERTLNVKGKVGVIDNSKLKSLSISCQWWSNKHNFNHEMQFPGVLKINPDELISGDFPELTKIFY